MVKFENAKNPEISIILPCRDEEKALGKCIDQIIDTIKDNDLSAEIIVSDSSKDSSPEIAKDRGAILVKHDKAGYGNAYLEGFKRAKGKYFFMADADGTYDFREIPNFIRYLKRGYDIVIGNRFSGRMAKDAMPWHHKHIGNPVLSFILRLFFRTDVRDAHCGMRAIRKESIERLGLRSHGMEFASEMIVESLRKGLEIKELPISYEQRTGESKLKSLRDGWRHLRFMLLYSPLYLFFIPGLFAFVFGILSLLSLYFLDITISGLRLYYHPMFISSFLVITGYQLMIFSLFAKSYAVTRFNVKSNFMEAVYKHITLERAGIVGIVISILGLFMFISILTSWIEGGFSSLDEVKNSIVALTLMVFGVQTIFSAFMLSILGIR